MELDAGNIPKEFENDCDSIPSTSSESEGEQVILTHAMIDEMEEDTLADLHVPMTKNELSALNPLEPFENPYLDKENEICLLGTIFSALDDNIVIQTTVECEPLNLDSLIVLEDRQILGNVFDTFGPIVCPFYTVRIPLATFPNASSLIGKNVYYVKNQTEFINTREIMKFKGTDASNQYDEEIDADEIEFSDDEKEMEYKKSLKLKRRGQKRNHENTSIPDDLAFIAQCVGSFNNSSEIQKNFNQSNEIQNSVNTVEDEVMIEDGEIALMEHQNRSNEEATVDNSLAPNEKSPINAHFTSSTNETSNFIESIIAESKVPTKIADPCESNLPKKQL
ncbi:H/ACA ribonucleoprotein complex, subunit Gar1/Naf1 domain-containing protein [Rozella allomycis CSF55]|uniref:H/ACA ribonucleoprotein complex subunit n=1 Tax=Rozella allomycis (strain CSF55) TaxID=988480 RepID=A0A075AZJ1_ROZAC|nr:H/ACA ribonucleoprotein complex, subunit Gar1/Naf1 domain-containing protein [Rozella allomycis CSF55]|eukprot:EPZ35667.1 H/ACA ribonucleoprotein complex, subunit Gar1/Naf1 domain-containing protein [Rozella allomycis CSF55]